MSRLPGNHLSHQPQGRIHPQYFRFPSILDTPEPPDLAVIIIPARLVPQTVEDCGKRGDLAVAIVTGGFSETAPDGAVPISGENAFHECFAKISRNLDRVTIGIFRYSSLKRCSSPDMIQCTFAASAHQMNLSSEGSSRTNASP